MYAENENENNEQRPMFIMTLELEDGNTEQIVLYKDSDPQKIANEFCCQHNLKVDYVKYLKEKIQTLLKESNVISEEDEKEGKGEEKENEGLNKESEGKKRREDNNDVIDDDNNNNNEEIMDVQVQWKESEHDVNIMNDKQNKEEKENDELIELESNNYNNANDINDNTNNNIANVNANVNDDTNLLNTNNQLINNNNNNNTIIPSQDNPYLNHQILPLPNQNSNPPTPNDIQQQQQQPSQSTITKYKEYLTDLQKPSPPDQTHHSTLTSLLPKPHIKPKINSTYTLDLNLIDKHQKHKHLINPSKPTYHPIKNISRKCHSKPNTPYTISTTTLNVFDRNYNYANQYKQNRIKLSSLYNTAISFNTKQHQSQTTPNVIVSPNTNTNKIITRVQCIAFSNLFKLLDNDDDGIISAMNMNTKALSHDVYRIIEPIINELKEEEYKLTENEFINVMFNLYVDINYYDKHLLINTFKHKQHHNTHNNSNNNNKHCCKCTHVINKTNTFNKSSLHYSFQPSINANASRLARKHDNKQHRLYNEYLSTYYNDINNINKHSRCIKSSEYFTNTNSNNNMKLSYNSIHNYTFNNYLKNLH